MKGETSGNVLAVKEIVTDCDRDALLIKAVPAGPTCHTGSRSCFGEASALPLEFLGELEAIIDERRQNPQEGSYTCKLFARGLPAIAQKVGEESTELIIAALAQELDRTKDEAADLVYHLLVLLKAKGVSLHEIASVLAARHRPKS